MPSSHCRWQTSRRRDRLPGDLQRIRAKAKAGAGGKCQAKHHAEGCNGIGTDSDHSVSGGRQQLGNLQWLSNACHKTKTEREKATRNAWYREVRLHSAETNPGSIQPAHSSAIPAKARFCVTLGGKSPNTIKAPLKSKSSSTLLERVPEVNYGHPIDFVVGGFRGVLYPPHAFRSTSGNYGFLSLPFSPAQILALGEGLG